MNKANIEYIDLSKLVAPDFYQWWVDSEKYLFNVLKGGRNSAKSSHVAIKIIRKMMEYPINTLVVRKIANTLHDSVFEQLKWAIEYMGVDHYWKDYKSPLRLVYLPTGQEILFKGANEPQRIKSIKSSKYPIAILWVEELAEFKTEDEIKIIVDSIIRAELDTGLSYYIYYTYNPPKRKTSFVNKLFNTQFLPRNTYVHHSSYLNNPYVSSAFIDEAESVKERNLNRYKWLYLGEPIGGGIVPFSNLTFRTITDDEVKSFDNIKQGLDFGWSIDPTHFGRQHFIKKTEKLYLIDEKRGLKLRNKALYDWVESKKYNDSFVIADSEFPMGIAELKSYGLKVRAAKKGPGSVEYGLEWLDSLNEIVIDYKRTPFTAKEFEDADYKLDRDGNTMAELAGEDHAIDQIRYSLEYEMKYKNYLF
jgi:PBSX family phage terminase large subunit